MEKKTRKKKTEEKEEKKVKVAKTQREYNFNYRKKKFNKARETAIVKKAPDGKKGRPKGTVKQYKFEETKIGFFLKYLCPVEYKLIVQSAPKNGRNVKPGAGLIEAVAIASKNSFLRSHKYFMYLEEYKKQGLWVKPPRKITPKKLAYFKSLRKKQEEEYLKEVRESDQAIV